MRLAPLIALASLLAFALPAAASSAEGALPAACVPATSVLYADGGFNLCVDADGPCLLAREDVYIWGTHQVCLVPAP